MHDHDGMNKVFALPILFICACVCVWVCVCVCVSILPDPLLTLLQQPAMLARSNGAEINSDDEANKRDHDNRNDKQTKRYGWL